MKEEIFPVYFDSGEDFRQWLFEHHDREKELWLGFYKKGSGQKGISYTEAVDEALCFGWIDGRVRRVDGQRYALRFSPRAPRSIWSAVNLKKIEELRAANRLHPAGIRAHAERNPSRAQLYSFEQPEKPVLPPGWEERLRANPDAWAWWQRQPESYRTAAAWLVISPKREDTRLRKLEQLIADCAAGVRLKELRWNT